MANWDKRFMDLAAHIAEWSKDRSTKVGCVVVGPQNEIRSTGYNGFPRGVNDNIDERHTRPIKYFWTEHSERNALYHAARFGIPLEGCKMYIHLFPCMDCARAIVQVGISEIIVMEPDWNHERWGESFRVTKDLFDEVGLIIRWYEQ